MLWIIIVWTTTPQQLVKFLFRIVPNFYKSMMNFERKSQLVLLGKRHHSRWSKPNANADVNIDSCPWERFGYADMFMDAIITIVFYNEQSELYKVFMDVIITIVFYNEQSELYKVFRFNLLNQVWLVFWLVIWINEWTNEWTNEWVYYGFDISSDWKMIYETSETW